MRRFLIIYLLVFEVIIFSISALAEENKSDFQVILSVPPNSIMSVTPIQRKSELQKRCIQWNPYKKPNFYVILKNISNKSQNIWGEHCSWGYENLYFEIMTSGGNSIIKKREVAWSGNVPTYVTIRPGEYYIIEVNIAPEVWDNFPTIKDGVKAVKLKAVYGNIAGDKESLGLFSLLASEAENFWEGKIESEPIDVTIIPWY